MSFIVSKAIHSVKFICIASFFIVQTVFGQSKKECDSLINVAINDIFQEGHYASAISKLKEVQRVAKREHYRKEYFLATNNLGTAHYQMLDYGNAIKYYSEAYTIALQNKNPLDEMSVLNNIAIVYAKDDKLQKANEFFKQSYTLAKKNKIESRISLYASNLAKINFEQKKIEVSKKYINEVLENKVYDSSVKFNVLVTKNKILFLEGKYMEVINNCILLIQKTKQYDLAEATGDLHLLLAKSYTETKQWVKAERVIKRGIDNAVNNNYKIDFFELSSLLALKTNKIHEIFVAKDSIVKLNNIVNRSKNQEILENSKLKFELTSSNHDLEINQEKAVSQQKFYLLITCSLVLILIILGWAFHKKNQVDKQKRKLVERNLQIADLEIEREKQIINSLNQELREKELYNELEKEKAKEKQQQLKYKIEEQNKQLSNKILFQTTRNELIEEIIEKISNFPYINDATKAIINDLRLHLKEDTKWDEFTANFENVNNDFLIKLKKKHANLNANDVRFLSFIYLNLSYKEIAALLNISPESCRKRKERIGKKMKLPSGKSLFEYLSNL